MSVTFPLATSAFQDILRFQLVTLKPSYGQETSGIADGTIRAKDLRPNLWQAQIQTAPAFLADVDKIQSTMESLEGMTFTFYMYHPNRKIPIAGTFDDSTVQINTLGTDGTSLSLKGLPANRVVTKGDMISFAYGSRPNYAFHRVLETVTANGAGVTPEFRVNGGVRTGATVNTPVKCVAAFGEFRMQGDWVPTCDQSSLTTYWNFTAIQVLL